MKRMGYKNRKILIVFAIFICLSAIMIIVGILLKKPTYYIQQDGSSPDNSSDLAVVKGIDDFTGRFPDVIQVDDGLLVAYYWNSIHAPGVLGDPLGKIQIINGSEDGEVWGEPVDLIDEEFLIDNDLGLWVNTDNRTYYHNYQDALNNNAQFCIEARDPNFCRIGNQIVLTFFTRLPWDSEMDGHAFLQYDEKYDYTYGRTYLMYSSDNGNTWSKPTEIQSDYLNMGCAKRGSCAVIDKNTLLIPLYGFNGDEQLTTSNVLARFDGNNWIFVDEYCTHTEDGELLSGAFEYGVTEVSLYCDHKRIYALCRSNGDVMISDNGGISWENYPSIGREEDFVLHQPSLSSIDKSGQIIASWAEPNEIGGRDIFMYLFDPKKDEKWNYNIKCCIYHNEKAGDMADPTSIFVDNDNPFIFTVYYDVEKQMVGLTKTALITIEH